MWINITVLIKVTLGGKTTGWNWRTCLPCWLHGPFKMQRRNNHHSKSQFNKVLVPLSPLCRQKLCKTFQGDLIRASTVHFIHPFHKTMPPLPPFRQTEDSTPFFIVLTNHIFYTDMNSKELRSAVSIISTLVSLLWL